MHDSVRHRATLLALAALYEVAEAAGDGPITPTLPVRAVLALLHTVSDGNREPYEAFWRACLEPGLDSDHITARGYMRATSARREIMGIIRTLGMEPQEMTLNEAIQNIRSSQRASTDLEWRARQLMAAAIAGEKEKPKDRR